MKCIVVIRLRCVLYFLSDVFLCHHLKSYIYKFKNDLACTANNLTAQYVNHRHVTCQTAQGLYMAFHSWISVKTVKVSQWVNRNLWRMATASGTGLGFYEIKNCQSFFIYILMVQKQPLEFDYH